MCKIEETSFTDFILKQDSLFLIRLAMDGKLSEEEMQQLRDVIGVDDPKQMESIIYEKFDQYCQQAGLPNRNS